MSLTIGSTISSLSPPIIAERDASSNAANSQGGVTSTREDDSVALSDAALGQLKKDQPSFTPPGPGSSQADITNYKSLLQSYTLAAKRVSDTTLSASFQSYADVINSSSATDAQKLQAYSQFKAESIINDTVFGQGYASSNRDFKFNWLTRDSNFIQNLQSDRASQLGLGQAPGQQIENIAQSQKPTIDPLTLGANLNSLQQSGIAINLASTNLIFAILNGDVAENQNTTAAQNVNHVAGFAQVGIKPVSLETAISSAVSQTLNQLSTAFAKTDVSTPAIQSYQNLFTQTVQNFGQYASIFSKKSVGQQA